MYNIVIKHLYNLRSDHLNISRAHLTPYIVICLWLCTLCCTLRPCDYFVTIDLYFLIPSLFSPIASSPISSANHQNVLCVYEFVTILSVHLFCPLDSTWKWNHIALVFLCLTYFPQHNTFRAHPCCCRWQDFILFLWLSNIPQHMHTISLSIGGSGRVFNLRCMDHEQTSGGPWSPRMYLHMCISFRIESITSLNPQRAQWQWHL